MNGTLQTNTERSKRKKGGQPNNENAVGHGAPKENKNAETKAPETERASLDEEESF